MKKKKRGFTLVELLAVIVILAVILVIAVPRIMSVIKDAKLGSIESTAKIIASTAESRYESKKALGLEVGTLKCTDVASLSNDYGTCKITFDDNGVATVIVNGKKDGKFNNLACQGTKDNMTCAEGEISTSRKCTTTDTLTNGLKFVDGQYTYRYYLNLKGWIVILTDKTSTEPVTTELCGTINDKPIVSMNNMFWNSKAESIDLSSFDTSKVTDMSYMFRESVATEIKGLENFVTSNVTNMESMFYKSQATSLDLSSFDTSNVTSMSWMFHDSAATEIKSLENFNTSKVTNMSYMFSDTKVTTLNLSNFDTSNVTDMLYMFKGSKATTLDLSNFNTSKVTSMVGMFSYSKATTLDLSSFDTSNVTNMRDMFSGSISNQIATTEIKGLENFDTSKVTDMSNMFLLSKVTTLDLSSFDTSNVTSMAGMFSSSAATEIKGLENFNTSKVTNMSYMFSQSKVTTLNLSRFDTSNVTNMNSMFSSSKATTGYARTQEDAARFNASSNKPPGLTFVVKSQ